MRLRPPSQSGAASAWGVPMPADFTVAAADFAATVVAVPAPDAVAVPLVAALVDGAAVPGWLLATAAAPAGSPAGAVGERVDSDGGAPSAAVAGCWFPAVFTDDVRWWRLLGAATTSRTASTAIR